MSPKRPIPARIRTSPVHFRDARLVIIATEGEKTERKYFQDLSVHYHNSHIKVHVLEKLDSNSSPADVIQLLESFENNYRLDEEDSLWLVCDVDRWGQEKLSGIAQLCDQKGYFLAISNPAFELWLLLHIKGIDEYSEEEQKALLINSKDGTHRTRLERELVNLLGEYNKSRILTEQFFPQIDKAIAQARRLDPNPDHRWINGLGSRVYLLVERMKGD